MRHWRILVMFLVLMAGYLRAQYVVQSGDTLSGIAMRTLGDGHRWREIAELNQLSQPYRLQVGQRLQLPKIPTVVQDVPPVPDSAPVPVAAETVAPEEIAVQLNERDGRVVSEFLSMMLGRQVALPAWLEGVRILLFMAEVILLLLYVPFLATGVAFAMFLFKQELSRRQAIQTAMSWTAITLVASLPLYFIDEQNMERWVPWFAGVVFVAMVLCIRATRKHTECSWLQSPFISFFGFVFGCATFETLLYTMILLAVGVFSVFSLIF